MHFFLYGTWVSPSLDVMLLFLPNALVLRERQPFHKRMRLSISRRAPLDPSQRVALALSTEREKIKLGSHTVAAR